MTVHGEGPFGVTYPVKSPALRRMLLRRHETCPECGGSVDVGYECTSCTFDGASEVFDAIVSSAKTQAYRSKWKRKEEK